MSVSHEGKMRALVRTALLCTVVAVAPFLMGAGCDFLFPFVPEPNAPAEPNEPNEPNEANEPSEPNEPNEPVFNNLTDRTNNGASYIGSRACMACHADIAAEHVVHGQINQSPLRVGDLDVQLGELGTDVGQLRVDRPQYMFGVPLLTAQKGDRHRRRPVAPIQ